MGLFHPCECEDYPSTSSRERIAPRDKAVTQEEKRVVAPVMVPAEKRSCSFFFFNLFQSKKTTDASSYTRHP